jgi:acetate---CoA ligase (ADP-forming)
MFRIIREWHDYHEHVLLRDGSGITLRLATPADAGSVESLVTSVSEESRYFRFMAGVNYVSRSVIDSMCVNNPADSASLLAVLGGDTHGKIIGIGNYISLAVRNAAEVSFLVADEYHGKGVGTLLLERLAGIAAANGFVEFEAEMLSANDKMMTVFSDAGFGVVQAIGGSTVHIEFPVTGNAAVRERAELRDRIASANSLNPVLKPSSIAVVGASRDKAAAGSLVFRHILESNYNGTVFPVNNQATSIMGVKAYSSITNLPEHTELVIIAVPAPNVLDIVKEAAGVGAKGIIVLSAGFTDDGDEGARLQTELVETVRSNSMRLIGPNCLGIINTRNETSLNASLAGIMPPSGNVGFFSHTGALGVVILDYAAERGIGFSTFVSGGNRGDVSGNDLLEYWEEDPATDIALLYLESFGNPRRFARVARRISSKKPVLCVKSARSKAGRETAQVRSNGTESDVEVDALFQQAGVIRAETLEEMFDAAMLLANQPLPDGKRVAIMSNAGGALTICADACESNGLSVARESAVNLGPLATAEDYERSVNALLEKDEVDSLIAIFACIGGCDPDPVGRAIRRGVVFAERATRAKKPVVLCLMGTTKAVQTATSATFQSGDNKSTRSVFPSYRFPESAALALARVTEYAQNRRQPQGRLLWFEDVDLGAAREKLSTIMEKRSEKGKSSHTGEEVITISGKEAAGILESFGVIVAPLGTGTPKGETKGGQAPGEVAQLRIKSDPHFGPLIFLSAPGKQLSQRITPLTDRDARTMISNAGIAESNDLVELLGRISQFVEELPWLWGMDSGVKLEPDGHPVLFNVELLFKP